MRSGLGLWKDNEVIECAVCVKFDTIKYDFCNVNAKIKQEYFYV